MQVASVDFLVDGQVVFTDSTAPYSFNFTVPVGITSLTLGATAVDFGGNIGLANDVPITVMPDPGTTVVGRVLDSNRNPVSGATVTIFGTRTATTGADGTFSIANVPTVLGNIVVDTTVTVGGQQFIGRSAAVPPVAGGTTDVGDITVMQCLPPPAGLVSWWPGDGNAIDVVGTNHGTLQNGATFAPGEVGQAFKFDGIDDYVTFGSTVGNFGTSDFTIDFWVKTSSTRHEAILGKRPVCTHDVFWQIRLWDGGRLLIELDQGGANYNFIMTTRSVNNGVFHHVAIVRQGPTVSVYIDGLLDVTGTTAGVTNLVNTASLLAGREPCVGVDGTQFFTGLLDEIELTNRALTATEIQALFAAGSAGKCKPDFFYMNDFEGPVGPEWSSRTVSTTPVGARKFLGEFGNDTVRLTLGSLPAHTGIRVKFNLFILKSWDGLGAFCCGPDVWNSSIDGVGTLLNTTFSNTGGSGNTTQSYPGTYPGASNPERTGAAENNTLGYSFWGDSVYNLSFTFPHTADSVSLTFTGTGLQGISDESWGLDNVSIQLVP